ncbi:sulfite exporter TauE/SafE family protein [Parvularcula marina]|uniref:sulfite exporter TauE/SafE family protein n=1 Tax=Parvularcula marina TaxID=2292771 RepID=UPI003516CFDD
MFETEGTFALFMMIGFVAQLIDGALGMAYGISATTALIALGLPPALASANVHTAEVFTSAASGASHMAAKNIDWRLVRRLAPAGVLGGILGTLLVSHLDTHTARPLIAAYLFYMGLVVLKKAIRPSQAKGKSLRVRVLGFAGGLCDAVGGGGWGPVVASRLLANGEEPAKTVGSTNLAEFFMTAAVSVTFLFTLGPSFGQAALGLVLGGVIAAPIAAFGARRLPRRGLMGMVGVLICLVSAFNIVTALT